MAVSAALRLDSAFVISDLASAILFRRVGSGLKSSGWGFVRRVLRSLMSFRAWVILDSSSFKISSSSLMISWRGRGDQLDWERTLASSKSRCASKRDWRVFDRVLWASRYCCCSAPPLMRSVFVEASVFSRSARACSRFFCSVRRVLIFVSMGEMRDLAALYSP